MILTYRTIAFNASPSPWPKRRARPTIRSRHEGPTWPGRTGWSPTRNGSVAYPQRATLNCAASDRMRPFPLPRDGQSVTWVEHTSLKTGGQANHS